MLRRKSVLLPALAITIFMFSALMASAASAAPARFGCFADAVRGTFTTSAVPFAPTVASATPCRNASVANTKSQSSGSLQVGATGAFTHIQGHKQAPGAAALASLTNFHVSGSGDQVSIATAQATVSYACVSGALQAGGVSDVTGLTINGRPISLPNGSQTERVPVDSHGSYVLLNRLTETSTSFDRVAAFVHIVGTGDFTVAETLVSQGPNPCAKTSGFPASVHPCTTGAIYDPASEHCLITAFTKRPIFISNPFGGPVGVAVYSLHHAYSVTHSRRCLRNRGAKYVMVGDPAAGGLIVATSGADRIVTLAGNYTIKGRGGKDCISAGVGANLISDGNAKVTIYGGSGLTKIDVGKGNDRIILGSGISTVRAGNGKDYVSGGPGHETIRLGNGNDRVLLPGPGVNKLKVGNGNDYIHGGAGTDLITAGNGRDTIYGGAGFGEITAGNGIDSIFAGPGIERISAGSGSDTIRSAVGFDTISAGGGGAQVTCVDRAQVTVPAAAVGFARAHGCKLVRAG